MNDIIEIYEPIYRETSKLPLIIVLLVSLIIIGILVIFLVKNKRKKLNIITPEKKYENSIKELTKLQESLNTINSYKFSIKLSKILKEFFAYFFGINYKAYTIEELQNREEFDNSQLFILLKDYIEPALFGKKAIPEIIQINCIKESVELLTNIYNKQEEKSV